MPTSYLVEIEFTTGVWTDVTSSVDMMQGIDITRGRKSEFDDTPAGTLQLSLFNSDGQYTPDNPLSSRYPAVVEGRGIRVSVTKGVTTSTRFRGLVTAWEPRFPSGEPTDFRVDVSAANVFAQLARRVLRSDYVEQWDWLRVDTFDTVALWSMDDGAANPKRLKSDTGGPSAVTYASTKGKGSSESETPAGINALGAVALTADAGDGPVIYASLSQFAASPVLVVEFTFRTKETIAAGGADKVLLSAVDLLDGVESWSVALSRPSGTTNLVVQLGGTTIITMVTSFADDSWYSFRMSSDGVNPTEFSLMRCVDGVEVYSGTNGNTFSSIKALHLGGRRYAGKTTNCTTAKFGPIAAHDAAAGLADFREYLVVGGPKLASARSGDIAKYTGGTATDTGTDDRTVGIKLTAGRTADVLLNEVARSCGGVLEPVYTGTKSWDLRLPDVMRTSTVALTLDVEADIDGTSGLPLERAYDTKPTRVVVTYPAGSLTVTGDETLGRVDDSIDSCAYDEDQARSVATQRLNASGKLRVAGLRVDLVTAASDLYSSMWALVSGSRIRLTSLPSTVLGYTRTDVYANGWTESYKLDEVTFTFDTSPADAPPEAVFDDAEYGRLAADGAFTVTGGTALGTTGTGTIIITTSVTGLFMSTSAGDYPLDLDWNGERVTVTSAPSAGAGVTQTLTLTARGVAPSVARIHVSGETIDVYHAAAFAF